MNRRATTHRSHDLRSLRRGFRAFTALPSVFLPPETDRIKQQSQRHWSRSRRSRRNLFFPLFLSCVTSIFLVHPLPNEETWQPRKKMRRAPRRRRWWWWRTRLEVGWFLKIRNCEWGFLLPVREMRNCEPEHNSFFDSFPILFDSNSGSNSRKITKNGQGIGIVIPYESESAHLY